MNKVIANELKKVKVANLNNFDNETNTYIINKITKPIFNIDGCYLIKLDPSLLLEKNVIATNWNNGSIPLDQYYKVKVTKSMPGMIYVDGIAYDPTTKNCINRVWAGWLPTEQIEKEE